MSHVIECPSGLVVKCREFKVKDENLLANKKAIRKGTATTDLIGSIITDVLDFGLYSPQEDGSMDWSQPLQGDRMVLMLNNRIETWGHEFTVDQPCANQLCRDPVSTEVDLRELEIKKLPKTSEDHVRSGLKKALQVKLPKSGAVVGFRLLNGADDRAMLKIQKQKADQLSSALLRYRTLWIKVPKGSEGSEAAQKELDRLANAGIQMEGQDSSLIRIPDPQLPKWIEEMSGRDSAFLRAAFDEHDCGVEQEIQFECPSCDHVWKDDVRFTADFLFPKYRGKTSTIS